MRTKHQRGWIGKLFTLTFAAGCLLATNATAAIERGFTSLFDGQTLNGWTNVGKAEAAYTVKDGAIVCPSTGSGELYSDKEYADFVLRLEYKVSPGANNGIGLRAPMGKPGDQVAYTGLEVQILDHNHEKYKDIKPWQANSSVYQLIASKDAAPKVGEWNQQEITIKGREIKVKLNGKTVAQGNLNEIYDPAVLRQHTGMFRPKGRLAFLGHGSQVEFKNIRIKEFPVEQKENKAPEGFKALFNGKDLKGWKGLLARPNDNPANRAKLSKEQLAEAQTKADEKMREHWKVANGALEFDGKGDSLATDRDYADFELLVDWKIKEKGDSGIYLRGSPQVQIWEPKSGGQFSPVDGSGGLYNNQKNPRHTLKFADNPVGEWNRFRIVMVGEKVHVFLNDVLVVNNTTMENYWERDKPIFPTGQIELQNHGNTLWFKNVFVREISSH